MNGSSSRQLLPPLSTSDVAEILTYIPSRPAYPDWVHTISAVGAVLTEDEAVAVLSGWSPEESPGEYQRKLRHRLRLVGIGSLIAKAKEHGFDASAFARRRAERARGNITSATPAQSPVAIPAVPKVKRPLRYTIRPGTPDELAELAKLRGLPSPDGLHEMQVAGCLAFTDDLTDTVVQDPNTWLSVKSWLVLDPTRRNVSARRLDRHPWNCLQGAKSRCLSGPGSKSWPIGITLAKPGQRLDVVEGEGDFLALWHLHARANVNDAALVGLLGSCANLAANASEIAPYVAGRSVQIFAHRDTTGAGQNAALKWAESFYRLGAKDVRIRNLTPWLGKGGKDLNDAVASGIATTASMSAKEADQLRPEQFQK